MGPFFLLERSTYIYFSTIETQKSSLPSPFSLDLPRDIEKSYGEWVPEKRGPKIGLYRERRGEVERNCEQRGAGRSKKEGLPSRSFSPAHYFAHFFHVPATEPPLPILSPHVGSDGGGGGGGGGGGEGTHVYNSLTPHPYKRATGL